jgi:hypothetical protein
MSYEKIIYLGLAMLAVVLIIYMLLPRLKGDTPNMIRSVLFFGALIFLGVDFYNKGKYWYIAVLALGAMAFTAYLTKYRNNKRDE